MLNISEGNDIMTTHEVEMMLGLPKQTLMYYEREGLVKPQRDQNNYRHYTQKEIDELKFIQILRSMDLSIDDIKLILKGELSIRKALETKEEDVHEKKAELENIEQKIKDYIQRKKVKISFSNQSIKNWTTYDTLYFNQNEIKYNDIVIAFDDIKIVDVSMCSAIDFGHNLISIYTSYYVDIDIQTSKDTYSFQILNNDVISKMFEYYHLHQIKFNDILALETLYKEKTDAFVRTKYLDNHFKKWAQKYHLDNPRENFFTDDLKKRYQQNQNSIKMFKNIFKGKS